MNGTQQKLRPAPHRQILLFINDGFNRTTKDLLRSSCFYSLLHHIFPDLSPWPKCIFNQAVFILSQLCAKLFVHFQWPGKQLKTSVWHLAHTGITHPSVGFHHHHHHLLSWDLNDIEEYSFECFTVWKDREKQWWCSTIKTSNYKVTQPLINRVNNYSVFKSTKSSAAFMWRANLLAEQRYTDEKCTLHSWP